MLKNFYEFYSPSDWSACCKENCPGQQLFCKWSGSSWWTGLLQRGQSSEPMFYLQIFRTIWLSSDGLTSCKDDFAIDIYIYILSEFAPLEFTFPIPTNCCFLSNQEGWQHRWSLPGGFRIWKSAFRDRRWEAMGAGFHHTLPWHLATIPPSAVSSFLISTSISSTTASSLLWHLDCGVISMLNTSNAHLMNSLYVSRKGVRCSICHCRLCIIWHCRLCSICHRGGSAVFEIVARATDGKGEWTERECNY